MSGARRGARYLGTLESRYSTLIDEIKAEPPVKFGRAVAARRQGGWSGLAWIDVEAKPGRAGGAGCEHDWSADQ